MTDPDGVARTDLLFDELGTRTHAAGPDDDPVTVALASWACQVDQAPPAYGQEPQRDVFVDADAEDVQSGRSGDRRAAVHRVDVHDTPGRGPRPRHRHRDVLAGAGRPAGGRRLGRLLTGGALGLATFMGSSVAAAVTDAELGALTDVGRVVVAWLPDALEPELEADVGGTLGDQQIDVEAEVDVGGAGPASGPAPAPGPPPAPVPAAGPASASAPVPVPVQDAGHGPAPAPTAVGIGPVPDAATTGGATPGGIEESAREQAPRAGSPGIVPGAPARHAVDAEGPPAGASGLPATASDRAREAAGPQRPPTAGAPAPEPPTAGPPEPEPPPAGPPEPKPPKAGPPESRPSTPGPPGSAPGPPGQAGRSDTPPGRGRGGPPQG